MSCSRCGAENPTVARFCVSCGQDLGRPGGDRRDRFAARPDEPVASFSVLTTIMPYATGTRPHTYRIALLGGLAVPLVAASLGIVSAAVAAAAFLVPVVYVLYLYDVNMWEDAPVSVVFGASVFTGLLALVFTSMWHDRLFGGAFAGRLAGTPVVVELLVVCLLVPIASELLKQVGPVLLASRPAFDDLMDGLTFGVVSGVSFAAFETLVLYNALFRSGVRVQHGVGLWISIVVTSGLVKPVVYGTASGIAVAEYSGLGIGYDGFTGRYVRGVFEAMLANVALQLGLYLFGLVPGSSGVFLGMLWGLGVAGVLVVRMRTVLHRGLLEASLESEARRTGASADAVCPQCEMPLVAGASFCAACGASVRILGRMAPPAKDTP